jgi:hypothetical protein
MLEGVHVEPVVASRVEPDVALAARDEVRTGIDAGRFQNALESPQPRTQPVARTGFVNLGPELMGEYVAVVRLAPIQDEIAEERSD